MSKQPRKVSYDELSPTLKALNPHLREGDVLNMPIPGARMPAVTSEAEKRGSTAQEGVKVRIPKKMTRTEAEFEAILKRENPYCPVLFEMYTLRLGNDCRYCPDFCVVGDRGLYFYEVKGAFLFRGATKSATHNSLTKPKLAAELFPWHTFYLAKKDEAGNWIRERFEPLRNSLQNPEP